MQFQTSKTFPRRFPILLCLISLAIAAPTSAAGSPPPPASPQADQDALYNQAVLDYKQNRLSVALGEFEKISGAHSQDAQQYISRIKAYTDAMNSAATIVSRTPDEQDENSLTYAIQKYEEAIKIKPDGPWNPAAAIEKAKALRAQLSQRTAANRAARDRDFCTKALGSQQEHHYKDAALSICLVANDNPGYSCGGDEAVHMCEQMKDLAKFEKAPPVERPVVETSSGGRDNDLDRAKAVYDKNDFVRARVLFQRVSGDLKSAADEYLDKISRYQDAMAKGDQFSRQSQYEEARAAFQNAAAIKADGPGNPQSQTLLMDLMQGMDLFYSGDYPAATQHLEAYAQQSTERQPLAHFYLGASKLASFFLAGSEDANLREDALNDLKVAKQAGFKATSQDVSPKILQAYKDLAF